jgi:hypothetical protein
MNIRTNISVTEEEAKKIKHWQKASPRNKLAPVIAELLLKYIGDKK